MVRNRIYLIIAIALLLVRSSIIAQETSSFNSQKYRIGFITGNGDQNVDYDYKVQFFQFQYYWVLVSRETWSLDLVFQPQYNRTSFRYIIEKLFKYFYLWVWDNSYKVPSLETFV